MDVEAATLDVLFSEAAGAFVHTLTEPGAVARASRRSVDLVSPELDLLLVDWLSELLFRFDTDGYLPAACAAAISRDEDGWRLHAEMIGEESAADRLPIKVLIKAVTYHQLEVRQNEAGWSARIIFDI